MFSLLHRGNIGYLINSSVLFLINIIKNIRDFKFKDDDFGFVILAVRSNVRMTKKSGVNGLQQHDATNPDDPSVTIQSERHKPPRGVWSSLTQGNARICII